MNNSMYDKLIEDCRIYRDVHLLTKWNGARGNGAKSIIAKPNFKNCTIIGNDVITELKKKNETGIQQTNLYRFSNSRIRQRTLIQISTLIW